MPIYEFRCLDCKRRTSVFVRSISSPVSAKCEHCGSAKMARLLSKFAVHRPGVSLDDDSAFDNIDENDPRAVARMMRQMGEESGEDMGAEFEEMVGRMEAGESPESVMGGDAGDDYGDDEF
jgi:putative FmdB family regulatory protein